MFNMKDILDALQPVVWLGCISGMPALNYTVKRNFRSYLWFIWSTVFKIIYVICFITVFKKPKLSQFFYQSEMLQLTDTFQSVMGMITVLIIWTTNVFKKSHINIFAEYFSEIDMSLEDLGAVHNYRALKRKIFFNIIIREAIYTCLTIIFFCVCKYWYKLDPDLYLLMDNNYPTFAIKIFLLQFIIYVNINSERAKLLKVRLEKICQSRYHTSDNVMHNSTSKYVTHISTTYSSKHTFIQVGNRQFLNAIYSATLIHERICDCCGYLSESFSLQLLIIIASCFVTIVCSVFYCLEAFFLSYKSSSWDGLILFLILILYTCFQYLVIIFSIVGCCTNAEIAGKTIGVLIHKYLKNETVDVIQEKMTQFSIQILQRSPKFSACGLFPIDNSLIFTMFGAATTYLIILIQFSGGSTVIKNISSNMTA